MCIATVVKKSTFWQKSVGPIHDLPIDLYNSSLCPLLKIHVSTLILFYKKIDHRKFHYWKNKFSFTKQLHKCWRWRNLSPPSTPFRPPILWMAPSSLLLEIVALPKLSNGEQAQVDMDVHFTLQKLHVFPSCLSLSTPVPGHPCQTYSRLYLG